MSPHITWTSLVAASLLLAACGGGSSSSSGSSSGGDLQMSVPEPTYVNPSGERYWFNFINQVRAANGIGLVMQDATLDQVALAHASYLHSHAATLEELQSGIESPQFADFTGATAQDRCNQAGYAGSCSLTAMWTEPAYLLRASPYLGLLVLEQGERHIGITEPGCLVFTGVSCGPHIQLGLASNASPQKQRADFLLVAGLWSGIHVQINEGEELTVNDIQVRDSGGSIATGHLLANGNDPLQRVPKHAAVFILDTPTCGASFAVEIAALRQSVPMTIQRTVTLICH